MILIVDDDPAIRKLIIRLLQKIGEFEYMEAEHGQDALRKFSPSITLVITDIDMPIMSGSKLIDEIRSDPNKRSVKIIVVSTHIHAGADDNIQKPFNYKVFKRKVLELLSE